MKQLYTTLLLSIISGLITTIKSQNMDSDKCGIYISNNFSQESINKTNNWGYGYADLETDLEKWGLSDYVEISSIGNSELGRNLYMLGIKNKSKKAEFRVSIHSRTHPNEVQAWYVTNEIINILLSESNLSNRLLNKVEFTVIPMINPDGVELALPRENSNNVDIESNWGNLHPEAEVVALKAFFKDLMSSELPIDVMLNMHSAYACKRYFVYHHENGTSYEYTQSEKSFISSIQNYFETGIEDWDYYVSWSSGTPTRYPESWFWNNYADQVMALTYEDMNCSSAGSYEVTAFALLSGIADYFELETLSTETSNISEKTLDIYPNPISKTESVFIGSHTFREVDYNINLITLDGNIINIPKSKTSKTGSIIEFTLDNVSNGVYIIQYESEGVVYRGKLIVK